MGVGLRSSMQGWKRPGFVFQVVETEGSESPIRRLRLAPWMAATVLLSNMWESHLVSPVVLPQCVKTAWKLHFPLESITVT